jgi:mRNA degradation ribonuclease J1/J2
MDRKGVKRVMVKVKAGNVDAVSQFLETCRAAGLSPVAYSYTMEIIGEISEESIPDLRQVPEVVDVTLL